MRKQKKSQRPLKSTALTLLGTACLGVALLASQSASAVDLRYQSVIEGNSIRLSDIFTGLEGKGMESKADRVLGSAPRPGHDMVLNARTLMRIAIALDLPWRPSSSADQIILRRAATIIDHEMISDVISNELKSEGLNGQFNVIIPTRMSEIVIPHDLPQSVEVSKIDFRPDQDRFEVELAAPSVNNPVKTLVVYGSVERLRDVPVLSGTLRNGDVIGIRDISYIALPVNRLKHNVILDAEDVIGMTPRRILTPDQPIKTTEIEAPLIVNRGENVTMVFKEGSLLLTAQGKAMQNGSKGDAIRVTNLGSSRTVEAIVSGVKEVTVISF